MLDELRENRDLMKKGDGESSSGSDDAPSEDNLKPDEIVKVLPVVDKKTKNDLAKAKKNKESELKNRKSKAKLPVVGGKQSQMKTDEVKRMQQPQERKTIIAPTKDDSKSAAKTDDKKDKKPKPLMVDACT